MTAYAYYANENETFKEEASKVLPGTKATQIVIKKLLRHYKLGEPVIEFTSGRNHSCAGRWRVRININQMNFLVVCHEVAHVYQAKLEGFERGDHWHTRKHRRIMVRLLNYCRKRNWFADELGRRLAPKPVKPQPTKDEERAVKIQLIEAKMLRYKKRLMFFQNKIKKANRKLSALKRFIKQ